MEMYFKKNKGFTLVEMIIYVAILAIVSVIAINATLAMLRAFSDIRVSRDVNNTATVMLERIAREVRGATSVDTGQSILGVNPGVLILNTKDSGGNDTTIEFSITNNLMRVKEGGVDKGALNSGSVVVDNIVYYLVSGVNSDAVKIEMQLTGKRGSVQKTRKFYDTVVLRGSY